MERICQQTEKVWINIILEYQNSDGGVIQELLSTHPKPIIIQNTNTHKTCGNADFHISNFSWLVRFLNI